MNPQGPAQYPAGGYAPTPGAPEPKRRTGILIAVAALVAIVFLAGGLAVFGPFRTSSTTEASGAPAASLSARSGTSVSSVPVSSEPATTTPDGAAVPSGAGNVPSPAPASGGGGGNSGGGPAAPQAPQAPQAPSAPSAPAPVINSFSTPESIDCHNGDFQMFSASWTTTNAVSTTISIDGPGVYKTYAANDSDSLPFSCSSPHTFLLTAYGQDGSTVSRSITLQPRNVQMPSNEDPEAQSAPEDEL